MSTLQLVPGPEPRKCHLKLAHQYGRGSNRRAVYVCQVHSGWGEKGCMHFSVGFRGFSVKKKPSPFLGAP